MMLEQHFLLRNILVCCPISIIESAVALSVEERFINNQSPLHALQRAVADAVTLHITVAH